MWRWSMKITNIIVTREFIPAPEKVAEGYKILYECLAELIINNKVPDKKVWHLFFLFFPPIYNVSNQVSCSSFFVGHNGVNPLVYNLFSAFYGDYIPYL